MPCPLGPSDNNYMIYGHMSSTTYTHTHLSSGALHSLKYVLNTTELNTVPVSKDILPYIFNTIKEINKVARRGMKMVHNDKSNINVD